MEIYLLLIMLYSPTLMDIKIVELSKNSCETLRVEFFKQDVENISKIEKSISEQAYIKEMLKLNTKYKCIKKYE